MRSFRSLLVLRLASFEIFQLDALAFKLKLISLNLDVLVYCCILPALQLITDQRSGAES